MVIYEIRNIENGKCYVGQTTRKFLYRKSHHIYKLEKGDHRNDYLQKTWDKYGGDVFEFNILEKCGSLEELNKREKYWIEKLDTLNRDNGYNLRSGGFNDKLTQETKDKLKNINTKRKGKTVYQYDLDGNYIETYPSLMEAYRNSGADRKSISFVCKGKYKTAGGYQWSFEKKDKLKPVKKHKLGKPKEIVQYDLEGNKLNEFNSMTKASKKTNTFISNISACCRGKVKTANNYIWRYKDAAL